MSHDAKKSKTPRPIRFLFENSIFLIAGALGALIWANLDPDIRNDAGQVTHHGTYSNFVHHPLIGGEHHETPHDAGGVDAAEGHDAHADEADSHADVTHADPAAPMGFFANIYDKLVNRPMPASDGTIERHGITVHFLINDILMALFFAIAAKEVWESLLPGGALSNPRKAATPLLATLGGVVGPAGLYMLGVMLFNTPNAEGVRSLASGWAIPCAPILPSAILWLA